MKTFVGQIRRLEGVDLAGDSLLVAVLSTDEPSGTAKVVPVLSPEELASTRDIVVPSTRSGVPFTLVLVGDSVASVWSRQLVGIPQVGRLELPLVRLARRAHRMQTDDLANEASKIGYLMGAIQVQTGDHLWWLRARTSETLASLSKSCTEAILDCDRASGFIS